MKEFPVENADLDEIVENLDSVTISRDLDSPEWVYRLIGKAVYNGYEIHRTPDKIELLTEDGPVVDSNRTTTEDGETN